MDPCFLETEPVLLRSVINTGVRFLEYSCHVSIILCSYSPERIAKTFLNLQRCFRCGLGIWFELWGLWGRSSKTMRRVFAEHLEGIVWENTARSQVPGIC